MINVTNGNVIMITDDIAIHSDTTVDELTSSKLYNDHLIQIRDMETGYMWYDFLPQKIGKEYIAASICMKNGKFESIIFGFRNPETYGRDPWKNWSQDEEVNKKVQQDIFLKALFNRSPDEKVDLPFAQTLYKFSWGIVWSIFDKKSGSSSMGLKYSGF